MSLIEIIRQTDSHTFLSPQTRKFHKLGQFVVPAWALRQPRLKTGILLATLIALAVLSASSTVALSAPHSQGVAGVSAISIGFGSVVVNTTSPAQHLAVENTGSASLFISRVALSGTYASRFAQSNNCPSSLAVGASCTISLTFTPNTPGNSSATLIVWTAGLGSRKSVSLNGVGVTGGTPAAGLSPGSLAFASQPVGKTSGAGTATLDNAGTAALSISSVTITGANPGDFAQANNCGSSLSAGSSCTFNITFTPAASGSRTALLSVADNSAGSPQTVSLSGTGTVASASLSPTSLSFGNQSVNTTSGVLAATLTNGGTAALSLSSIALTGANAGAFAQTNTCGSSLAAGASCKVSVTFDPTATGSQSASVSFTDNASGSPQSLSLSGTGTSATVSLSPSSLSFANQPISVTSSTQIVTLTNGGSTALSISSLTITGTNAADFAEVANTCGSSVAAGANCSIGVAFTPSTSKSETASLAIADNATGSPQTVSLSGLGIHNVVLLWTPSSTSGVVGYNVYRGTTSGGESSTPLNSTPVSGTTFTDESVTAGSTYYYVVTTVGSDDTQSPASAESSSTVPST